MNCLLVWMVAAVAVSGISAKEERTLAFVFDVAFSMVADLEHLKLGIQEILFDVVKNIDDKYSHYLFLGFHDPVVGLPFVTDNKTHLLEFIKTSYVFPLEGNNDCEEQCLPAIYHTLYTVHEHSDILVFTDNNSKGAEIMPLIMDIIPVQKPKISFIITPGCNFQNIDENYEKIAMATGGQIYETIKRNVSTLLAGVGEQLRSEWTTMLSTEFNVGGVHDITIDTEGHKQVLISLTGYNVELRLFNPSRMEEPGRRILDMKNAIEVVLDDPNAGEWTLQVKGDSTQRLRVMGHGRGKRGMGKSLLGIFFAYCTAFGLLCAFCVWQYKWFWGLCVDFYAMIKIW